jgi:hypothetical protein
MIASLAGGSITLTKNNVDGAEIKDTNDGHRHLCFPLSSHFEYTMYFGTTIQFYNDTIMQSQYISSQTHTLQIRWRRVTPVCREHFRGGEFRSQSLQVFAAAHSATRGHDQPAPPNDQSLLSTSSQISSIKRRYAISIISYAICRSSLSVGIRPAEDGIKVSARAVTPSQPLQLRSFPMRCQELNTHTRAVRGPPLRSALSLERPFGYEGVH